VQRLREQCREEPGIGSTTAVFSVAGRILFRSLPYGNPERLVSGGLVAQVEPHWCWHLHFPVRYPASYSMSRSMIL
jgi:hypothetical protein